MTENLLRRAAGRAHRPFRLAIVAAGLLTSAAFAQTPGDHVWTASQATAANWISTAVARPSAFMAPSGSTAAATIAVLCSADASGPTFRLHYRDTAGGGGKAGDKVSVRIDGGQTVALDHVAGGDWLSRGLPSGYGDAIRGGDSLTVERAGSPPLRLHLRGSDATMFALIGLCLP